MLVKDENFEKSEIFEKGYTFIFHDQKNSNKKNVIGKKLNFRDFFFVSENLII